MKTTLPFSFRNQLRFLAPALLLTFTAPFIHSADVFGPPSTIDYQGSVLDGSGNPLAPTTPSNYEMQFRLYDAQTGGSVIWAEKQLVTVKSGKFSVRLGEGTAILGAGASEEGSVSHDSVGLPGAFAGKERYLGVTVVIPGQQPGEIQPRLAFLASPFSYVAASAQVAQSVNQPSGSTPSSLNIGSVSYANQTMTATGTISASAHTILVNSSAAAVAATLPAGTAALNHQLLITKKDISTNQITVAAPAGGTINGVTNPVYLKVRGESITIQNVGNNDWWIVADSRDKTPVGTIISYSSNTVPAGYLAANGDVPLKSQYPELVAALGTAWGVPADNTKFRVPDLRGSFLRGKDGGRTYDEDRNGRTADYVGAATGDNVGSYQGDQFRFHNHNGNTDAAGAHSHSLTIYAKLSITQNGGEGWNGGGLKTTDRDVFNAVAPVEIPGGYTSTEGNHTHSFTTNTTGGNETRPENYSVNYCIKY